MPLRKSSKVSAVRCPICQHRYRNPDRLRPVIRIGKPALRLRHCRVCGATIELDAPAVSAAA